MPELGNKYECAECGTKFYDLGNPAAVCPKCGTAPRRDAEVTSARCRSRVCPTSTKRKTSTSSCRDDEAVEEVAEEIEEEVGGAPTTSDDVARSRRVQRMRLRRARVAIGLGGNLGDPADLVPHRGARLRRACSTTSPPPRSTAPSRSRRIPQPPYLNTVLVGPTGHRGRPICSPSPRRSSTPPAAARSLVTRPRPLDVDLLLYDDLVDVRRGAAAAAPVAARAPFRAPAARRPRAGQPLPPDGRDRERSAGGASRRASASSGSDRWLVEDRAERLPVAASRSRARSSAARASVCVRRSSTSSPASELGRRHGLDLTQGLIALLRLGSRAAPRPGTAGWRGPRARSRPRARDDAALPRRLTHPVKNGTRGATACNRPSNRCGPPRSKRLVERDRDQRVIADALRDALAHRGQRALGLAPQAPVHRRPEVDGGAQAAVGDRRRERFRVALAPVVLAAMEDRRATAPRARCRAPRSLAIGRRHRGELALEVERALELPQRFEALGLDVERRSRRRRSLRRSDPARRDRPRRPRRGASRRDRRRRSPSSPSSRPRREPAGSRSRQRAARAITAPTARPTLYDAGHPRDAGGHGRRSARFDARAPRSDPRLRPRRRPRGGRARAPARCSVCAGCASSASPIWSFPAPSTAASATRSEPWSSPAASTTRWPRRLPTCSTPIRAAPSAGACGSPLCFTTSATRRSATRPRSSSRTALSHEDMTLRLLRTARGRGGDRRRRGAGSHASAASSASSPGAAPRASDCWRRSSPASSTSTRWTISCATASTAASATATTTSAGCSRPSRRCAIPATEEWGIGIDEGGVHALEALVLARYYMFTQVYFNVTGKVLELHLNEWLASEGAPLAGRPRAVPRARRPRRLVGDARVDQSTRARHRRARPLRAGVRDPRAPHLRRARQLHHPGRGGPRPLRSRRPPGLELGEGPSSSG